MGQMATVDQLVSGIERAACDALDEALREAGVVFPPTVHVLAEDRDPPHVGFVTCRPFYRGADAADAITELGVLPAALRASRLLVTWEAQDLNVALAVRGDPETTALAALDATLHGHAISWYPFRLGAGRGREVLTPQWGRAVRLPDAPLPGPVESLLHEWRHGTRRDATDVVRRLESAGHRVRWVAR